MDAKDVTSPIDNITMPTFPTATTNNYFASTNDEVDLSNMQEGNAENEAGEDNVDGVAEEVEDQVDGAAAGVEDEVDGGLLGEEGAGELVL